MEKQTLESIGLVINRVRDFFRWGGDSNSPRTWFLYNPATLFINQYYYD